MKSSLSIEDLKIFQQWAHDNRVLPLKTSAQANLLALVYRQFLHQRRFHRGQKRVRRRLIVGLILPAYLWRGRIPKGNLSQRVKLLHYCYRRPSLHLWVIFYSEK